MDAGIAGMAALLEEDGKVIKSPEGIDEKSVDRAITLMRNLYNQQVENDKGQQRPLLYFLLQEVIPGSSWDQVKTGDVAQNMQTKYQEYVDRLVEATKQPPLGRCFITGGDAHILVSKKEVPMLASSDERPNCYPNLSSGLPVSAWVALSVLFSPLGIEKTVNEKGKGGLCLIHHSSNWRFMVEIARRNLLRLRVLLAAKSIEGFRANHYGKKAPRGTWRLALSSLLDAVNRIDERDRPQVVIWSFNASNQSCRYENMEIAESFLILHQNRRLHPAVYRDISYCSDEVSRLILQGKPIARYSIIEASSKKSTDKLDRIALQPGWALQRLYAERVINMPVRLLDAIERAAGQIARDSQATKYCLFSRRIRPITLAKDFKVSGETCAVFSDYHRLWEDYLRAAVLWASKGNEFPPRSPTSVTPGEIEKQIKEVSTRLREKHGYKRLAMTLNAKVTRQYRLAWLRLLRDGACTWEDFLAFNPLDEALSIGKYHRTSVMRDYLIAYLLGCANERQEADVGEGEIDESEDEQIAALPFEVLDEETEEEEI